MNIRECNTGSKWSKGNSNQIVSLTRRSIEERMLSKIQIDQFWMNYFNIFPSASIYLLSYSSLKIFRSAFPFSISLSCSITSSFKFSIFYFKSDTYFNISLFSSSLAFVSSFTLLIIILLNKKLLLLLFTTNW